MVQYIYICVRQPSPSVDFAGGAAAAEEGDTTNKSLTVMFLGFHFALASAVRRRIAINGCVAAKFLGVHFALASAPARMRRAIAINRCMAAMFLSFHFALASAPPRVRMMMLLIDWVPSPRFAKFFLHLVCFELPLFALRLGAAAGRGPGAFPPRR